MRLSIFYYLCLRKHGSEGPDTRNPLGEIRLAGGGGGVLPLAAMDHVSLIIELRGKKDPRSPDWSFGGEGVNFFARPARTSERDETRRTIVLQEMMFVFG